MAGNGREREKEKMARRVIDPKHSNPLIVILGSVFPKRCKLCITVSFLRGKTTTYFILFLI